jgi:peptidyl-prolyl cis-trans isomerase A (cyclophilin A)
MAGHAAPAGSHAAGFPHLKLTRRATLVGAGAALTAAAPPRRQVVFTTVMGAITLDLAMHQAPLSCADFLHYVTRGYYDGGQFFRVVRPDNDHGRPQIDVVQGGIRDPKQAWAPIAHETTRQTGLRHQDGTVSLTRDTPGTGSGAEIFICIGDQPALDFGGTRNKDGQGFAAFARVSAGMDIVRGIWKLPANGHADDAYTAGQILGMPVIIRQAKEESASF